MADPQIIDAHTYPGRPWPLSTLTMTLTDNYMRRSYRQLQEQLHPDTVFFLGDLFDGGREWRTGRGDFHDPEWSSRPERERAYAKMWRKKYDENYWLREYARFGDIFLDPWNVGGTEAGLGQRGRRVVASLPGNHDLGFGSEVQVSVRNRFETYFGEGNRVDVIGNHTFVSVDTVSMSADTSERAGQSDVGEIFGPSNEFLGHITWAKQRAVARELRYQRGTGEEVLFAHGVEDLETAHFDMQRLKKALGSPGGGAETPADLPTVLLTHVPLYREPGTPCGPLREHWPPSKPAAGGQDDPSQPVFPDHRNAISVTRGYQYQNVLNEADSVTLVKSIGNVVHAFSGDDHDYCEVVHDVQLGHVPEITVKSFSMAMGVPTPGFLMVSLYNPINATGHSLLASSSSSATMQTRLCLLPNQLSTYARYGGMAAVSVVLLAIYAVLIHILRLPVFAFDPLADDLPFSAAGSSGMSSTVLPMFNKAKVEDDEYGRGGSPARGSVDNFKMGSVAGGGGDGSSDASGFIAFRNAPAATYSRGRSYSNQNHQHHHQHKHRSSTAAAVSMSMTAAGVAAAGVEMRGPKIQIAPDDDDDDDLDDDDDNIDGDVDIDEDDYMVDVHLGGGGGRWQPAARRGVFGLSRSALRGVTRFVMGVLGRRGGGGLLGGGRRRRGGRSAGGRAGGVQGMLSNLGGLVQSVVGNGGGGGFAAASSSSASSSRRRRGRPSSQQQQLQLAGREFYAMAFRVTWMVVACLAWLNYRG